MKTIISSVIASLSGNGIWVLLLINLAWLLFKDHTLFSWWWVIGCTIVFLLSISSAIYNMIKSQ